VTQSEVVRYWGIADISRRQAGCLGEQPRADVQGWIAAQRPPFGVLAYADTIPGLERGDGK
jgi:hypothetical protein